MIERPTSPSLSRRSQLKLARSKANKEMEQADRVYRSVKRVLVKHKLRFQVTRSHQRESIYIRAYGNLTKDFRVRISCHKPNRNAATKNDIFIDARRYSRVSFDRIVQAYARHHRELIEATVECRSSR